MTLPDIGLQVHYLDIGWGLVIAAGAITLVRRLLPAAAGRNTLAVIAAASIAIMWLPGYFSPSFWLGMAFQYPSLFLVALCTAQLAMVLHREPGRAVAPVLPRLAAASLFVLGLGLYAGSFVWVDVDVYAHGFSAFTAPVIATALVLLWASRGATHGIACAAIALACLIHAVTGLPSGNAWDALLDPMLFTWCAIVTLRMAWASWRQLHAPALAGSAP